ncbi:hypothetical protein T492DRAFT_884127 [Pavlovales sp. CCMP2436]|nr:hypothetical protein T492DRAFT_884127 [Pavlovales sp. CCMP2436]
MVAKTNIIVASQAAPPSGGADAAARSHSTGNSGATMAEGHTHGLQDAARFLAAGAVFRDSTGLYLAAIASLRAAVASAAAAAAEFFLGTATAPTRYAEVGSW